MPPPDYAAAVFEPGDLAPLLGTRGAVLLRGLLPKDLPVRWLPAFEAGYTAYDRLYAEGGLSEAQVRNFYDYGHVHPEQIPGFSDWLAQVLGTPMLTKLLQAFFGSKAYLLLNNCAPRRQGPHKPQHAIGFHQDQEFMGPMRQAVNLWIPLTPAGGDWPGLELWLDGPQVPLLHLGLTSEQREQLCARIPPQQLWRPELEPGDALLFTPYTLHRTRLELSMSHTRISSEIRLISAADTALTRSGLMEVIF